MRPTPVCTSSTARSAPTSRAISAAARTNSASSGITPPSPSTGSSRIAASSPPGATAASSDSTSFGRANEIPGTSGPKPSHFAGWPVAERAPSVLPWKPPSSATIRGRPVAFRATLSAASFASAPELQKNACAPPARSERSAASRSIGSVQ